MKHGFVIPRFLVGIVGNQGAITADAASKGAHFVSMCTERNVPLIFLQNTMPSLTDEEDGIFLLLFLILCSMAHNNVW